MRTRSSHRWPHPPGNWDPLHLSLTFGSDNAYGIPMLAPCYELPSQLVAYGQRRAILRADPQAALHFYLDDYRIEPAWKRPAHLLATLRHLTRALTPDFSLLPDMPRAAQVWQVYRTRWIGAYLKAQGITVLPTVRWSTPQSYDVAFLGIPHGSYVAVSARGIRHVQARAQYVAGLVEMYDRLRPGAIVCYGRLAGFGVPDYLPIHEYPSRWDERRVRR